MEKLYTRIPTLDEFKNYIMGNDNFKTKKRMINYLIDRDVSEPKYTVYDADNNKYVNVDKKGNITDHTGDLFYSFMVLDFDENNKTYKKHVKNSKYNRYNLINFGKYLVVKNIQTVSMTKKKLNSLEKISIYSDERGDFFNLENSVLRFNYILHNNEKFIYYDNDVINNFHSLDRSLNPFVESYTTWGYDELSWECITNKNIIISTYAFYTGLKFDINSKHYNELISTSNVKKIDLVQSLYEKATQLCEKSNIRTEKNKKNKLVDKFLNDSLVDSEICDFTENSYKQIVISSKDLLIHSVNFNRFQLKAFIKPYWFDELTSLCKKYYPLRVNLVIKINADVEDSHITDLIEMVTIGKVHSCFTLPSNVSIILKTNSKKIFDILPNKNVVKVECLDNEFTTKNFGNSRDSKYLMYYTPFIEEKDKEDVRDYFIDEEEIYFILKAGSEEVKIPIVKQEKKYIDPRVYHEVYTIPHREHIDNVVRQRVKK